MSESSPSDGLRDVYERRAELEYRAPVEPPDPRIDRKFERVAELVRSQLPVHSFLDAGCGDGRYFAVLADAQPPPGWLAATDISARILETARAAAEAAGLAPELVRANLESLPFEDGVFELVLCSQVIEHLLDPAAGVRELARVLAPGGTLIVTTDNARNLVTKTLWAPRRLLVRLLRLQGRRLLVHFPEVEFTPAELRTLVTEAGLAVESLGTCRFQPPPPFGSRAQRAFNRLDKRLPPHRVGDILYAVARKH